MTDVAKAAGVSLKSVSRVINGESHISQKLRSKVEAAINDLGYVPDRAARSLAGGRSFIVGILFGNPSPNYTMNVLMGAYAACRASDYHLQIDNINSPLDEASLDSQLEDVLRGTRVEGYVITPPLVDDLRLLDRLEARGIAYSRIAPIAERDRSLVVDFDDYSAAAAIADHLIDLGHTRFGLVSGPDDHGRAPLRSAGFTTRLRERLPQASLVEAKGTFHFTSGIEAGRELLARPEPPTAIFAANDDMAAGVISAAVQHGRKVPEEVSVAGFDDSWIAQSVWPPLTTVRQPISSMAEMAVKLLLGKGPESGRVEAFDFAVVERSSTTSPQP